MRLTFEIETELEAQEENPLYFGEVIPNAGNVRIPLGHIDMGVFSIRGPQNMDVNVTLDIPEYLVMDDDEAEFRIPMNLELAYANVNENNTDHAVLVPSGHLRFPILADAPTRQRPDQPVPAATAYIFVFGEIDVGDIPTGTYNAQVVMSVEYE